MKEGSVRAPRDEVKDGRPAPSEPEFARESRVWKSCGRDVDLLWTIRQCKMFCGELLEEPWACTLLMRLRPSFRLSAAATALECSHRYSFAPLAPVKQHRFEETINGRPYMIEVSIVGRNQWRAQIARIPGGSTAMMPFYGTTPDEAAALLARWLSKVSSRPPAEL